MHCFHSMFVFVFQEELKRVEAEKVHVETVLRDKLAADKERMLGVLSWILYWLLLTVVAVVVAIQYVLL